MEPECRQCDLRKAIEEADKHREAQEKVPQPEDQEDLDSQLIILLRKRFLGRIVMLAKKDLGLRSYLFPFGNYQRYLSPCH